MNDLRPDMADLPLTCRASGKHRVMDRTALAEIGQGVLCGRLVRAAIRELAYIGG